MYLLPKEQKDEVCDARDDDSSTGDDYIIIMEIIRINEING
jgi:hypothetical protein